MVCMLMSTPPKPIQTPIAAGSAQSSTIRSATMHAVVNVIVKSSRRALGMRDGASSRTARVQRVEGGVEGRFGSGHGVVKRIVVGALCQLPCARGVAESLRSLGHGFCA